MRQAARYERIHGLRAAAALAVVLFHANASAAFYLGRDPLAWMALGKYGVDLFFVISGFVIYLTARVETNGVAFLARRLERVLPLYWFVVLAMACLAWIAPAYVRSGDWSDPARVAETLAFVSFARGNWPTLYVGWTIEFEMLFYLVTALAILVLRRPWGVLTGALVTLASIGALVRPENPVAVFITNPLMLEFAFGIVIGRCFVDRQVPGTGMLVIIAGLLLWLSSAAGAERVLLAGIPAAAVVSAALLADQRRPVGRGPVGRSRCSAKPHTRSTLHMSWQSPARPSCCSRCILGSPCSEAFSYSLGRVSPVGS